MIAYLCPECHRPVSQELSGASVAFAYPSMTSEVPTSRPADKFFAFTSIAHAERKLMSQKTIVQVHRILKKAPCCIVLYCKGFCTECLEQRGRFAKKMTKAFDQLEPTFSQLEFRRGVETERARWLKLLEDEAKTLHGTSWETYMAIMDLVHVERAKAKAEKRSK